MAVRVTTNSMVRNYNSSLTSSLSSLNRSREQVMTKRKFVRAYQDPTGALRASELTRKADSIDTYLTTLTTAQGRQDSADGILQQIVSLTGTKANEDAMKAVSAATPETRKTYATSLRELQKTLLQLGNATHGEDYLLAGSNGGTAPFELSDDGTVTYRGIEVSDPTKISDLDKLVSDPVYLDLGLGLRTNGTAIAKSSADINGASAFDTSYSGLKALGYGTVDGSDPPISKNAIELLGQMADELESTNFSTDRFNVMRTQLSETHSDMADYAAEVGVRGSFLENTKTRLEEELLNIEVQLDSIVTAQPAEAITDYSYSQYVYNLVLKVGGSLLTSSFIDFMK